jgi:CBS domain-containing protein
MLAKEIMTKDVITVKPEDTVKDAAKLLAEHKISGMPVVNGEREVVGIVSEGDFIVRSQKLKVPSYIQILGGIIYLDDPREFKEELRRVAAYLVKDIMTEEVVTVDEDTEVEEVASIMFEEGVNRVPVVDAENRLAGIVSRADIVRSLAHKE